jgi:hypothetical protein
MDEEQLKSRAVDVQNDGTARFGERDWGVCVAALSRCGIKPAKLAEVIGEAATVSDAANIIMAGGRDRLIAEASDGDRAAANAYAELRERERKAYRLSRGRS